jgi:AcrR family transcriptional regulator
MAAGDADHEQRMASFSQLRRGPRLISAEEAARQQRTRLQEAMIEIVLRSGFAATTVGELVGLAEVSKSTFYELFTGKEDCFLAAFDRAIARAARRVAAAYGRPGDFRGRLTACFAEIMELVVEDPGTARFVVVESLTLGAPGIARRQRAATEFEAMVQRGFEGSRSRVEVSGVVVRGVVAGLQGVIYRHLRAGEVEALPGLVSELVDWALSYQRRPGAAMGVAMRAAGRPAPLPPDRELGPMEAIPWAEPASSARSRSALTSRERIERAAVQVVAAGGYPTLSIPGISAAAGISNTTFYAQFSSKREAFLAGFATMASQALRAAGETFASLPDRREGVGAGIRALLEFYARQEIVPRIIFVELATAGPGALDRVDEVFEAFTGFLRPGAALTGFEASVTESLQPAIVSAVWAAIEYEVAHGRIATLPDLGPDIALLVTGPMSRPARAAQAAAKRRAPSRPR